MKVGDEWILEINAEIKNHEKSVITLNVINMDAI